MTEKNYQNDIEFSDGKEGRLFSAIDFCLIHSRDYLASK